MKTLLNHSKLVITFLLTVSFFMMNPAFAAKAQLPYADQVPAGEPMAIDGVWKNAVLNKNFRFEGGRGINLEPWVAYIFWKVEPEMVAMQNITQAAPGKYIGYNLIDKQSFEITLQSNGILKYKSAIFSSDLIPVQLDNPEMMAAELANLGGSGYAQTQLEVSPEPAPAPAQNPEQSNCSNWAIDPETNTPVCMD